MLRFVVAIAISGLLTGTLTAADVCASPQPAAHGKTVLFKKWLSVRRMRPRLSSHLNPKGLVVAARRTLAFAGISVSVPIAMNVWDHFFPADYPEWFLTAVYDVPSATYIAGVSLAVILYGTSRVAIRRRANSQSGVAQR
jgi:hypothetical protein